ncbi:Lar family restriction alleviation protein [Desulfuromonas acetoxidans]|uniref:Lar family restriction alleviation protein n=1 Tax=Desulfuromonas acetoxidans TaxID=891 RepID=UPI00292FB6F7|nr:Lar family restriction alleviation protein [Desulfuromonas acetoxidans]
MGVYEGFNLKPCPFCGNAEIILSITDCGDNGRDSADIAICGDCGAVGPWGNDEQHAVDLWNNRIVRSSHEHK